MIFYTLLSAGLKGGRFGNQGLNDPKDTCETDASKRLKTRLNPIYQNY